MWKIVKRLLASLRPPHLTVACAVLCPPRGRRVRLRPQHRKHALPRPAALELDAPHVPGHEAVGQELDEGREALRLGLLPVDARGAEGAAAAVAAVAVSHLLLLLCGRRGRAVAGAGADEGEVEEARVRRRHLVMVVVGGWGWGVCRLSFVYL